MGTILNLFVKTRNDYFLAVLSVWSFYINQFYLRRQMLQVNVNHRNHKFYVDIYTLYSVV